MRGAMDPCVFSKTITSAVSNSQPSQLQPHGAFLIPCLGALATVAVALLRRHRTQALVTLAGIIIALTMASRTIGTILPPSFASLLTLALLTTAVLRLQAGGTAVMLAALAALAALAVAAEALRPMVLDAAYLLVVCLGAFGVAVSIGVYLRWSDWRRVAAEEAARTEERLAIARELHDMVGHCVTGIVVQAQAAPHIAKRIPLRRVAAWKASRWRVLMRCRHASDGQWPA